MTAKPSFPLLLLLSALIGNSAFASDLAFNAYLGIPFDGSGAFFGANCEFEPADRYAGLGQLSDGPRVKLDLRYSGNGGTVMSLNDVRVTSPLARYASETADDGEPAGTEKADVDWHLVAAAVLGAGLIAAVASADSVKVSACSGPNCPPEKPPVDPEPADDPGQDQ
jgi:hypothetical protein